MTNYSMRPKVLVNTIRDEVALQGGASTLRWNSLETHIGQEHRYYETTIENGFYYAFTDKP